MATVKFGTKQAKKDAIEASRTFVPAVGITAAGKAFVKRGPFAMRGLFSGNKVIKVPGTDIVSSRVSDKLASRVPTMLKDLSRGDTMKMLSKKSRLSGTAQRGVKNIKAEHPAMEAMLKKLKQ